MLDLQSQTNLAIELGSIENNYDQMNGILLQKPPDNFFIFRKAPQIVNSWQVYHLGILLPDLNLSD